MKETLIASVNVGMPKTVPNGRKEVETGIFKSPVEEGAYLGKLGFEGDEQADLKNHGGSDKAACVYSVDRFPFWENGILPKLGPGAFGENLSIENGAEEDFCIGDTFAIGEAVVQLSQPRQPCFKLSVRYGVPELPAKVQETGYSGFYFRVLQEGLVREGDRLELVQRHEAGISVMRANEIMYHRKEDAEAIRSLLAVEELSASWRNSLEKRLAGLE
ncbi:MOSC domain-containing protein [Saccharibacillus sp. CPCC 101409]|uniref:MOSC domain-containing protein n=1 Tax=Saccharibacillus sp. CPCC 101409 TaxID=3058041 RepID=UPI002673153D|nr:MOSC domain-containing protein [Saccharibacillus sp. CPCC 101409]MDO3408776.1 MOSC domain-containing protein [Saccharibacillus sp. CPCC 101409]